MKSVNREGLSALDLEASAVLPDAVELARERGRLTLVAMLRHKGIHYGIGASVIESLHADGLIERDGDGWAWTGRSMPGLVARLGGAS